MDRFFKIVGIVVVALIALGLVGSIVGFLVKAVFWIAIIIGIVYVAGTLVAKGRRKRIGK